MKEIEFWDNYKKMVFESDNRMESKKIRYPFGKYEIEVLLGPDNEFVGISEVSISKFFRCKALAANVSKFHDVDEYYS